MNENLDIKFELDNQIFETVEKNNSYLIVKIKDNAKLGKDSQVKVKLSEVRNKIGSYKPQNIQAVSQCQIVSRVQILKDFNRIVLPFVQSQKVQQIFQLYSLGGSGFYQYNIQDTSKAFITSNGIITVVSPGETKVIVSDKYNNLNTYEIPLIITNVNRIYAVENTREMGAFSDNNDNFISAEGLKGKFNNCTALNIELENNENIKLQLQQDYEQIIEQVLKKSYLIKDFKQLDLDIWKNYREYINNKEITLEKISNVFQQYQNNGICHQVYLSTQQSQELSLKYVHPIDKSITCSEQYIRVYESFHSTQPKLQNNVDHVLITPFSSFQWEIRGGPQKEKGEQKQVQIILDENNKQVKDISVEIIKNNPYYKKYQVTCDKFNENGKYRVKVVHQNSKTDKLPRPLEMFSEINVICGIPKYLEIMSQESESCQNNVHLLNQGQAVDLKLTNDNEFDFWLRGLDQNRIAFYNISSLNYEWKLDDSMLGNIKNIKNCTNTQSNHAQLKLNKAVGATKLNAEATSVQNHKFNMIHDDLQIKLLKDIQLNTEKITIFNDENNIEDIIIENGSGNYKVNQHPKDLVQIQYEGDKIRVKPLKPGQVQLEIEDLSLLKSKTKHVQLNIASVAKIVLSIDNDFIQAGRKTNMHLKVYDENDNLFSQTQLNKMNLKLHSNGITEGNDKNYTVKQINNLHEIQSYAQNQKDSSHYIFYFELDKLQSNKVGLEIFQKMTSQPSQIVLSEGCFVILRLLGGPTGNSIKYEFQKSDLVNIERIEQNLYNITAKANSIQKSEIKFSLFENKSQQPLTSLNIDIKVQKIDRISILGGDRDIFNESQVRLISQLFIGSNLVTNSICPFTYQWQSEKEEIIFVDQNQSQQQVAVNATALKTGSAKVNLRVQGLNFDQKMKTTLNVVPQMLIDSPTFIQKPNAEHNTLILPPNSRYEIKDIGDNIISSLCPGCNNNIRVNQNILQTSDIKGEVASFKITDKYGKQIGFFNVETAQIHSVFVEDSYKLTEMQNNSDITLKVILQDIKGRSFPTQIENVNFDFLATSPTVITGEFFPQQKNILNLRAINDGNSFITVSLQNDPNIYDIFYVSVGSVLQPANAIVHTGGTVQFQIASSNSNNYIWTSNNENICKIDKKLGLAIGVGEGKAQISYRDDSLQFKSDILVVKVQQAEIIKNFNLVTNYRNHIDYQHNYNFRIKAFTLLDKNQKFELFKKNNLITNDLKIICKAQDGSNLFIFDSIQYKTIDNYNSPVCQMSLNEHSDYMPKNLNLQIEFRQRNNNNLVYTYEEKIPLLLKFKSLQNKSEYRINTSEPIQIEFKSQKKLDVQGPENLIRISQDYNKKDQIFKLVVKANLEFSQNKGKTVTISVIDPDNTEQDNYKIIFFYGEGGHIPVQNDESGGIGIFDIIVTVVIVYIIFQSVQSMKKYKEQ